MVESEVWADLLIKKKDIHTFQFGHSEVNERHTNELPQERERERESQSRPGSAAGFSLSSTRHTSVTL